LLRLTQECHTLITSLLDNVIGDVEKVLLEKESITKQEVKKYFDAVL